MGDWTKLLAIQALLPLSKWVMLLDADAIIVDHSTQFDTIIQAAKTINSNAEVVISNCKECSRNNPDFDPLLSINVGVMFVHNSQWSHEWINKLYMRFLTEQHSKTKKRVVLMDHSVFNAQPHDVLPSGSWDSSVVHLAGLSYWHP